MVNSSRLVRRFLVNAAGHCFLIDFRLKCFCVVFDAIHRDVVEVPSQLCVCVYRHLQFVFVEFGNKFYTREAVVCLYAENVRVEWGLFWMGQVRAMHSLHQFSFSYNLKPLIESKFFNKPIWR